VYNKKDKSCKAMMKLDMIMPWIKKRFTTTRQCYWRSSNPSAKNKNEVAPVLSPHDALFKFNSLTLLTKTVAEKVQFKLYNDGDNNDKSGDNKDIVYMDHSNIIIILLI
jgi:hypothetical protein